MASNTNPGNFANRPHEEVENLAKQGGRSSHEGGFHNMDPNKQVINTHVIDSDPSSTNVV